MGFLRNINLQIFASFLLLIFTGSVTLFFFGWEKESEGMWIKSLFTGASAVCVTGLTIADISRELNFTGQIILLVLIQLGGLGLLTLSNFFILAYKKNLTFHGFATTNESFGKLARVHPFQLLKLIILFTLICEVTGALLLFSRFIVNHPLNEALWLAIFHSVSAFCNAGFSLFSNNLENYKNDTLLDFTIMILIIMGGLGFVVVIDIIETIKVRMKGLRRRVSLQTRSVIITSFLLVLTGTVVTLLFEWNNSLESEPIYYKFLNSLFLSVTARTAGFNTFPVQNLHVVTAFFTIILMIIGASSGSTGGGVKTNTITILFATIHSFIRNSRTTHIFNYHLPIPVITKMITILALYFLAMITGVALIATFEQSGELGKTGNFFLTIFFETVSALSTVGLSMGITSKLTQPSQMTLVTLMIIGRVGLLIIIGGLQIKKEPYFMKYPNGEIMAG